MRSARKCTAAGTATAVEDDDKSGRAAVRALMV